MTQNQLDTFSPEKRSDIMRRVPSVNTIPEIKVRSLLHALGFRFRLHRKDLPGKPDIVLSKHSAVIFVHGCFWHRHPGCLKATTPATNQNYWRPKFKRTVKRDLENQRQLRTSGWNVIIVWECELRDLDILADRLQKEILTPAVLYQQETECIRLAAEDPKIFRQKEAGWRNQGSGLERRQCERK